MWEALEQVGWVQYIGGTGWLYAAVSVVHYLSFFVCVGSMAIIDLRVMGVAAHERKASEIAAQLFPWVWTGFVLAGLSGFLMFATDAGDWAPDPVFHYKLLVIFLAAVFAVVVQVGVPKWEQVAGMPKWAKVIALISLLLFLAAIVVSSEIPSLEGLG